MTQSNNTPDQRRSYAYETILDKVENHVRKFANKPRLLRIQCSIMSTTFLESEFGKSDIPEKVGSGTSARDGCPGYHLITSPVLMISIHHPDERGC
jgi:hypothetical protein